MKDLQTIGQFPFAKVKDATSLEQVFDGWRSRGLMPVKVTREQFVQSIHITHDTMDGKLAYTRDGMDGLQAIALLFDTIVLIAKHELFSEARPNLLSGKAAIALRLDGNTIEAIHDPPTDPVVLRGLLMADLINLLDLAHKDDFDPLVELGKLIHFEVKSDDR